MRTAVTHYSALAAWPATLLSLSLIAQAAAADGGGIYVGANAGDTLSAYRRSDLNNAVVGLFASSGETLALSSSSVHSAHAPWSVDVGYRFSTYFSVEASYLRLATEEYAMSGSETSALGSAPGALGLDFRSRGPALALVGVLPMTNDWNLDARLGAYEGKTITQYASSGSGASGASGSDSKTSTSLLASAGVEYVLTAHWVLRLDYTRLNKLGEKILGNSFNVDLVTGGVSYAF